MRGVFKFGSEEALCAALTSGLVPEDVSRRHARISPEPDGGVWVEATVPTKSAFDALISVGVGFTGRSMPHMAGVRPVRCWAEALSPRRAHDHEARMGVVLFVVEDGRQLLDVAAEMLRLGCDRQEFRFVGGTNGTTGLLRVANPPYYTVVRALEGGGTNDGVKAYLPTPAGQELVWTEVGWSHPLVDLVQAPGGQALLIPASGDWRALAEGHWVDIYQLLDLQIPTATEISQSPMPRLAVPLRLSRAARTETASLWVLREGGIAQVDRLLQQLPQDVVGRLLYAVGGTKDAPVIVLRTRLGRQLPPDLTLMGEAYAPLLSISHLFVPTDAILEPPLRRDTVRELLAPSSARTTWLAPVDVGGGFQPESLPDDAFTPLADWVDYLVTATHDLESWVRATTCDFATFESANVEWPTANATVTTTKRSGQRERKR